MLKYNMQCNIDGCKNKSHSKAECSKHLRVRLYGYCKNGCTTAAQAKHGYCSRCVIRNFKPPRNHRQGHYLNTDSSRYCWSCDSMKVNSDFAKNRSKSSGFNSMCKNCLIKRNRGYDRDAIMDYYKKDGLSMCLKCGSGQQLEIDHIVPLSWGGSNEVENLQVLCRGCNSSKSNNNANDYRKAKA